MIESEENKAESEPAEATEEVEMADREEVKAVLLIEEEEKKADGEP